jgi:hypothetical protein
MRLFVLHVFSMVAFATVAGALSYLVTVLHAGGGA